MNIIVLPAASTNGRGSFAGKYEQENRTLNFGMSWKKFIEEQPNSYLAQLKGIKYEKMDFFSHNFISFSTLKLGTIKCFKQYHLV